MNSPYTLGEQNELLENGRPIAKIDPDGVPNDGLNPVRLRNLFSALEFAFKPKPKQPSKAEVKSAERVISTNVIDDIDDTDAAGFLVKHHVPFIGPDMGTEIIKIVRRLDTVGRVYPLSPTLEAYRMSLHLILQVATKHQAEFCKMMEGVLAE